VAWAIAVAQTALEFVKRFVPAKPTRPPDMGILRNQQEAISRMISTGALEDVSS
jgi:hypothetical protein